MKRIGLIGGMSWQSSHVYYQLLNQRVQSLLGGAHSCDCVMVSVDFAKIEKLTFEGDWDGIGEMMAQSTKELERAGAGLIILCTNTIHLVSHYIEKATDLPFLHIADATGQAIQSAGMRKVALLGTQFTMEKDFYTRVLEERYEIETIIPKPEDRKALQYMIYEEMVKGQFREDSKATCESIIHDMQSKGAEGVILGCTELPILLEKSELPIPDFNTTEIHAWAAVEMAGTE